MTTTWNASIPALTNQVSNDIPDIEENFLLIKDILENITDGTLGTDAHTAFSVDTVKAKNATGLTILDAGGDHVLTLTTSEDLSASRGLTFTVNDGARTIDLAGNLTTQNNHVIINAVDAARTLTLAGNLTTQNNHVIINAVDAARTLTLAGNLTTQNNHVIINAVDATRTLTLTENFTIGGGSAGTLTFSAATKTLTVADNTTVNQNIRTTDSPTFAALTLSGASTPQLNVTDTTNTVTTQIQSNDTTGQIGTSTTHSFIIFADNTTAITIDTSQNVTLAGNLTVADGGTVGQAAGPLLTFDDTNDLLEITGCNVLIGETTSAGGYELEVKDSILINTDNAGNAILYMWADNGDDNADKWRVNAQPTGTFDIQNFTSGTYVSKLSIAAGGDVTFSQDIIIADGKLIGSASDPDAMSISAGGDVTFTQDIIIADGKLIGSASDLDAMSISAGGDVTFTQDIVMASGKLIGITGDLDLVTLTANTVTVAGTLAATTLTGNLTVADGGTVGQAAGPLLTFDDTNDLLEITGCNVLIGETTSAGGYELEVKDSILINTDNAGNAILYMWADNGDDNADKWRVNAQPSGTFDIQNFTSGTYVNKLSIATTGNTTVSGTLTVSGDQSGATDHVFDDFDDIKLLKDWRNGDPLPFHAGDLLNRDRLLRDAIIQQDRRIRSLENEIRPN